ncbi:MAG: hypothetical protein ACK55Z_10635, partial [bacterium]
MPEHAGKQLAQRAQSRRLVKPLPPSQAHSRQQKASLLLNPGSPPRQPTLHRALQESQLLACPSLLSHPLLVWQAPYPVGLIDVHAR